MTTPPAVARKLIANGWVLTHRSHSNSKVSSIYLRRAGEIVRISDHFLGSTIYGEAQSGGEDYDVVLQPHWTTERALEDLAQQIKDNS